MPAPVSYLKSHKKIGRVPDCRSQCYQNTVVILIDKLILKETIVKIVCNFLHSTYQVISPTYYFVKYITSG